MGVVYIGDRSVGKTHLAVELANPRGNCVKVNSPSYADLKATLAAGGEVQATAIGNESDRTLEITVQLPRLGSKRLDVQWLDSAGECWRTGWQDENPHLWKDLLEKIHNSQAALLILPPYREMLIPEQREQLMLDSDRPTVNIPTQQQWQNRFKRWVDFFINECNDFRHILICINKADLFTDIGKLSQRVRFNPDQGTIDWTDRDSYIRKRFFYVVEPELNRLKRSLETTMVYCFVTTIYDRGLLELPWIYLGSRFAI